MPPLATFYLFFITHTSLWKSLILLCCLFYNCNPLFSPWTITPHTFPFFEQWSFCFWLPLSWLRSLERWLMPCPFQNPSMKYRLLTCKRDAIITTSIILLCLLHLLLLAIIARIDQVLRKHLLLLIIMVVTMTRKLLSQPARPKLIIIAALAPRSITRRLLLIITSLLRPPRLKSQPLHRPEPNTSLLPLPLPPLLPPLLQLLNQPLLPPLPLQPRQLLPRLTSPSQPVVAVEAVMITVVKVHGKVFLQYE